MIPTALSIITYATEHGTTNKVAANLLLAKIPPAELVEHIATALAKAANTAARRLVTDTDLNGMSTEQLTLLTFHHELPSIVRIETEDGDEMFKDRQDANLDEHAGSLRYKRLHHLSQAGICERKEQRIYESDFKRDIAIGYLMFANVRCAICDGIWTENDALGPFEQAHDDPVAGRSGNPTARFAHRKCNRSEGA